jgi:hypothetical protein
VSVNKAICLMTVTDEAIVDYGLGTEDDQREAAARIAARQWAAETHWRGLPRRVRVARRLRARWDRHRARFVLAMDALRGRHECDA